jgi:hypothetical protein
VVVVAVTVRVRRLPDAVVVTVEVRWLSSSPAQDIPLTETAWLERPTLSPLEAL